VFINGMCDAVVHSHFLLFADYMKIFRSIKSSSLCKVSTLLTVWNWTSVKLELYPSPRKLM
jgi:hypothetical protein